jgi:hypothetical protein
VGSGSEFVLLFLGVLFKKRQNDFQKVRLLLSPHVEQSNGVLLLTMQQNQLRDLIMLLDRTCCWKAREELW